MRKSIRVAAVATVIALIGAFASMGQAKAATPGVGTTETESSLIDIALGTAGSLLRLRVLPDQALASIDPAAGASANSAFAKLSALSLTSSILPAPLNNISIPVSGLESRSPGGNGSVSGPAINLTSLGVPAAIASGSLVPVGLTSLVNSTGAKAGLDATLADVGLLGGILSVDSVTSKLGAAGTSSVSNGFRGLTVDAVSVLDLGSLLKGLGIDLQNLPIPAVSSILDVLNVGLPGLTGDQTLGAATALLNSTLGELTELLDLNEAAGGLLDDLLGDLLPGTASLTDANSLLGGLGLGLLDLEDPIATVVGLVGTVTDILQGLLESALDVLGDVSLLKIGGLELGAVTKAVNSVGGSQSDVIGKLGTVQVGGLNLGALDLSGALSTVTGLIGQVNGVLNGVTGALGLGELLHLGLFEKASTNGVTASNGYVRSLAGITGLNISITPPANLLNIVNGILPANGIGAILGGLGGTVPTAGAGALSMGGLTSVLNGLLPQAGQLLGALAGGASIKVASLSSGSNFVAPNAAAAAPTPVSQLPRTGLNTAAFLVIGMLMVGGVIIGRRFMPTLVATKK